MKTAIIIPARMASSRLPEKPLADIGGQSMVMRTYRQACQVAGADWVCVATDHPKIADHVIRQGGNAMLTSAEHISGTDRIAEIARRTDFDLYINVQGDEPFIEPKQIEDLLGAMVAGQDPIATQCRQIADPNQLFDYNVVKVVRDKLQRALYFSRQAIPAFRDKAYDQWLSHGQYYRHIGIYAFRRDILLSLANLPASALEMTESLEQLRWMEHGLDILCIETPFESMGIDTPDDLEKARQKVSKKAAIKAKR